MKQMKNLTAVKFPFTNILFTEDYLALAMNLELVEDAEIRVDSLVQH